MNIFILNCKSFHRSFHCCVRLNGKFDPPPPSDVKFHLYDTLNKTISPDVCFYSHNISTCTLTIK